MTSAIIEEKVSLWPALTMFAVVYLVLSAAVAAVLIFFDLNSNTGASVAVLLAATAAAAQKFVGAHARSLRRGEQLRFALLATAVTMLLTLVQVAAILPLYFTAAELPQLAAEAQVWAAANVGLLVFIAAFVVVLFFAVLYLGSGWFSRMFVKRLNATGKI
jgi:hypothetical protein